MTTMKQIYRVASNEVDGNEDGDEWAINYVVYINDSVLCQHPNIELWEDDGAGNGTYLADFGPETPAATSRAISICSKLGTFVEYEYHTRPESYYSDEENRIEDLAHQADGEAMYGMFDNDND